MSNYRSSIPFKILRRAKHGMRNWYNEVAGKRPKLQVDASSTPLTTLGTEYGGWTFADTSGLVGATIISCGAGEDISFDVLFAAKYGARVIIVDPTPSAAIHVKKVIEAIAAASRSGTLDSLELYGFRDFFAISPEKLIFVEKAIWKHQGSLKLFPPKNPEHVSHSALDFQNDYEKSGEFIEVEALTYGDLVSKFNLEEVPLLKLDIEGAEVEVLTALSEQDVLPAQICVEYDELLCPNRLAAERVKAAHDHLINLGYRAAFQDVLGVNFLYVRST